MVSWFDLLPYLFLPGFICLIILLWFIGKLIKLSHPTNPISKTPTQIEEDSKLIKQRKQARLIIVVGFLIMFGPLVFTFIPDLSFIALGSDITIIPGTIISVFGFVMLINSYPWRSR
jgi:di/tricarboxylate transporter